MKTTLIARFGELQKENIGAIPTLSKAIRSGKFTDKEVRKAFKKVVPKDEYESNEKNSIMTWLLAQTEHSK